MIVISDGCYSSEYDPLIACTHKSTWQLLCWNTSAQTPLLKHNGIWLFRGQGNNVIQFNAILIRSTYCSHPSPLLKELLISPLARSLCKSCILYTGFVSILDIIQHWNWNVLPMAEVVCSAQMYLTKCLCTLMCACSRQADGGSGFLGLYSLSWDCCVTTNGRRCK